MHNPNRGRIGQAFAAIAHIKQRAAQRGRIARSLVALLALVILGASATAITYLITNRNAPLVVTQTAPAEAAAPIFVGIEPFTVSLNGNNYERVLHVALTLKVADERTRERLTQYQPVARSRLLLLLSEQDPEAVQTSAGKRQLANDIRHAINQPFTGSEPQQVIDVLFTAFVVQ
nr:flagellar basal body-associated protein FliL [Pseudomonas sp.]